MGYKILGFAVWRAAKWYLKRRLPNSSRKLAIGGAAAGLVIAGLAVLAQRQASSPQ